jgi:trimeric autotransporter adhesin
MVKNARRAAIRARCFARFRSGRRNTHAVFSALLVVSAMAGTGAGAESMTDPIVVAIEYASVTPAPFSRQPFDSKGYLQHSSVTPGWFDPPGFKLGSEPGETPRFDPKASGSMPVPDDIGWSDQFGLGIGCNGPVYAIARAESGVYFVGGSFTACGSVAARDIAQFDPATRTWSPLPNSGIGEARSILAVGADVYVGSADSVKRWDGSAWHDLGSWRSLGDEVLALAMHDGALYAGGYFSTTDVAGNQILGIARWNGTYWESLGWQSRLEWGVHALASYNGELVAGGYFFRTGSFPSVAVGRIARWNGSNWLPLGSDGGNGMATSVPGVAPHVAAMTVWQGALYVTGNFTAANAGSPEHEVAAAGIARWDGVTWSSLGTGLGGARGRAVVGIGGELHIGGFFFPADGLTSALLTRWDGSNWSAPPQSPTAAYDRVFALAEGEHGLLVGGSFGAISDQQFPDASPLVVNNLGEMVAGQWHALGESTGSGVNGPVYAMARFEGDLYIGGFFTSVAGVAANYIARWDGEQWHAVGTGAGNGLDDTVTALVATPDGLFVGGYFNDADIGSEDRKRVSRIARWDGSSWRALEVNGRIGVDGGVFALRWSAPDLYVGGSFIVPDSATPETLALNIARWDGGQWHALGTGDYAGINGTVSSLAMIGESLYAAGRFRSVTTVDPASHLPVWHVAKWDGAQWHPVGSAGGDGVTYGTSLDFFSRVYALAVVGSNLYVGGTFLRANVGAADPVVTHFLARWDGSSWHAIGPASGNGVPGAVSALYAHDGHLFVAGAFSALSANGDSVPAKGIGVWNGHTWSTMGSGLPEGGLRTHALLAEPDGGVYVGGNFALAGDKPSSNLAHYNATPDRIFKYGFE